MWDRLSDLVHHGMYEASVRIYMLYFVGCTILVDKSRVYIDVKYICKFTCLEHCSWA